MICGIHHTALSIKDMERSLAFYRDLLGLEVVMDQSWENSPKAEKILGVNNPAARHVHLKCGNAYIELYQFKQPEPAPMAEDRPVHDRGITHLCLDVKDVDAEYERLSKEGIVFHSDPVNLGPKCRCVYGRDPDGNVIEFQELFETPRW
ncbi:MAG: VOC family protein [Proteobacteria bacterium]|nr:VOC family protein [Pseudomonadota bacterium]